MQLFAPHSLGGSESNGCRQTRGKAWYIPRALEGKKLKGLGEPAGGVLAGYSISTGKQRRRQKKK